MKSLTLYYTPDACSLSPHIVLREGGFDFTQVKVDLANKKTEKGEDFLTINPKGQVPTLALEEGIILTEGPAILQYLADSKPEHELLAPIGSLTRYQTLEWVNYISTELHKSFAPLFRPETPEEYRQILRQQLEKKFQYVDHELAEKQWLMGMHFTIADPYLFVMTRWAKKMQVKYEGLPSLADWTKRINERPCVVAALKAEAE